MLEAFGHMAKGAAMLAHKLALSEKRVAELQAANEAATRRRSHKRKRIQREGTLVFSEGVRLTTLKEFNARSDGKKAKRKARVGSGTQPLRRCSTCGEAGHNARTCKKDAQSTVD